MVFDFVDAKTLFLIGHLLGIALGVGGALISDLLFLKSIKDRKISKTEMGFLTLASHCVTAGIVILILSGLGMFLQDTERYLDSSKFIAKMAIVGVLTINGIIFHTIHIPRLKKQVGRTTALPHDFSHRMLMLVSGVVSIVSWISALVLGAFRSIPWSTETILSMYGATLLVGLCISYFLRDHLMPSLHSRK